MAKSDVTCRNTDRTASAWRHTLVSEESGEGRSQLLVDLLAVVSGAQLQEEEVETGAGRHCLLPLSLLHTPLYTVRHCHLPTNTSCMVGLTSAIQHFLIFQLQFLNVKQFQYFPNCRDLEVSCDSSLQNFFWGRNLHVDNHIWVRIWLWYGVSNTVRQSDRLILRHNVKSS